MKCLPLLNCPQIFVITIFISWRIYIFFVFEIGSHYVAIAGLEPREILLPLPSHPTKIQFLHLLPAFFSKAFNVSQRQNRSDLFA